MDDKRLLKKGGIVHIDQLNRRVKVSQFPQRIISLVPSQTELLFDLGLEDRIVGLTRFCIHPANYVKEKQIIGGPKNFRFDKIDELAPNLIIGNKEENYPDGIEALASRYPVWMSDVNDLKSAYEMISSIGSLTGQIDKAIKMLEGIRQVFNNKVDFQHLSVVYLIWNKPFMAAGLNTFINSILKELHLKNLVIAERYPEMNANQL